MNAGVAELFHEAMASLVSGVAVITARRSDGHPCGLAATSVASYSANPPSVLVSVAHASRCHAALSACEEFGLHLLDARQEPVARTFAGRGDDKFSGLDWNWDGDVPRLHRVLSYLRCRRAESFDLYDHTLLIGDVRDGSFEGGRPLVYSSRRMDWLLRPGG